MWRCHQDVADVVVVVVVVVEVEVAEDLPPHVIPGMIYMSCSIRKILKFHVVGHVLCISLTY